MRLNLDKALAFTLKWEGVYSNDKIDPGGETKWGIARKYHPEISAENWANFTLADAENTYKRDYWDALNCDSLPHPLDIVAFDTGVNLGVGRAKQFMKQAKNDWKKVIDLRRDYYRQKVVETPAKKKYLKGWLNRCDALVKYCEVVK